MEAIVEQHRRHRIKATQTATRQRNGAPQLRRYPMTMRSQGTATRSWVARLFLAILVAKSFKLMETKRDVIFTKMLRCSTRISRMCPQVRALMLEVPFGSSASPLPRRVSALRVVSSVWGVTYARTVIVSAMESSKMATAQVDSMWLKRLIVPHG